MLTMCHLGQAQAFVEDLDQQGQTISYSGSGVAERVIQTVTCWA